MVYIIRSFNVARIDKGIRYVNMICPDMSNILRIKSLLQVFRNSLQAHPPCLLRTNSQDSPDEH